VDEFKRHGAVQTLLLKIKKSRVDRLNDGGTEYSGLLARIANNRRVDRTKCTCRKREDPQHYQDYIATKKLDVFEVTCLIERLNAIREFLCVEFCSKRKDKLCYCNLISVEEMLLDNSYIDICYKNFWSPNEKSIATPKEEENMLGLLFG
jgi:hypothetical protein